MEILELNNTLTEMKILLDGLNIRLGLAEESVTLKTDKQKLYNLKGLKKKKIEEKWREHQRSVDKGMQSNICSYFRIQIPKLGQDNKGRKIIGPSFLWTYMQKPKWNTS